MVSRRLPRRVIERSRKVRTDGRDMLFTGAGSEYSWLSDSVNLHGDYYPGGKPPQAWVGQDVFDGRAIGPGGGFPWHPELVRGNYWNTPGAWNQVSVLPGITRALAVIVNPVVRAPWHFRRGDTHLPLPNWITDPMMRGRVQGNNFPVFPWGLRLNSHEFWTTFLSHAILWGLGAFVAQEDAGLNPVQGTLRIINPFMLGRSDSGNWVISPGDEDEVETDFDGCFTLGGVTWRLYVMHGAPPVSGMMPEGVLQRHWDTFHVGATIQSFQHGQFHDGTPSGFIKVLQPNYSKEQAEKLKNDWMAAHGGSRKSVAVLNAMADFVPVQMASRDAETSLLKTANLADIALAFGLSPDVMGTAPPGGGSSVTYANISSRRRELVDYVLTAWSQQITETLAAAMPRGTRLEIEFEQFVSSDMNERIPALLSLYDKGIIDDQEVRARAGFMARQGDEPRKVGSGPSQEQPEEGNDDEPE